MCYHYKTTMRRWHRCFSSHDPFDPFIMSSCTIVGFFELTHGIRTCTDIKKADGTTFATWHVYYDTSVICSDSVSLPAELRKYSPPKEPILANDTVAFVVAKLNVPQAAGKESKDSDPQTGNVLLEALHIVPIPGDPTVDSYQAHLPDFVRPLIFALGTIAANPEGPADGVVTFPLAVFDFVRGGMKECTLRYVLCMLVLTTDATLSDSDSISLLRCILDKSAPQWRNLPMPRQGAVIEFMGRCSEPTAIGHLFVDIESIVFCTTPSSPSSPSSPTANHGQDRGSNNSKCRKFGPRAAPHDALVNEPVAFTDLEHNTNSIS